VVGWLLVPGSVGIADARQSPLPPSAIIAKLNAERVRHGLPAGVTHNPSWSRGCRLHNRWERLNLNGGLEHGETPGTAGYTEAGNQAGMGSVLAGSPRGWRAGNPWTNAPIHLSQVYNPGLRTTGASDAYELNCMYTWPGVEPPDVAADTVWTVPRDQGRTVYAQRASELPFVPQQAVGIPAGRVTGPYLYVFSASPPASLDPPLARLVRGSLVGAGGSPVQVAVIDDDDIENYVGPGDGFLLPVRPLRRNRLYSATVVVATGEGAEPAHEYTYSWTFRTTRKRRGFF
jgi:hypothetical protein